MNWQLAIARIGDGGGSAKAVTLDELLEDPVRAAEVPVEQVPALFGEASTTRTALDMVIAILAPQLTARGESDSGDRLLKIDEAATRLATTKDWLRRRPDLPFVVKLSDGVVRYSAKAIERFIATRAGRRS